MLFPKAERGSRRLLINVVEDGGIGTRVKIASAALRLCRWIELSIKSRHIQGTLLLVAMRLQCRVSCIDHVVQKNPLVFKLLNMENIHAMVVSWTWMQMLQPDIVF